MERSLFALPARLEGLGIVNPTSYSASQFKISASVSVTSPLVLFYNSPTLTQ